LKEITVNSIHIRDLEVPGFELLSDEENYLDEISSHEFNTTLGGSTPSCVVASIAGTLAVVAGSIAISAGLRKLHDSVDWF
jgi:hypothetical protein